MTQYSTFIREIICDAHISTPCIFNTRIMALVLSSCILYNQRILNRISLGTCSHQSIMIHGHIRSIDAMTVIPVHITAVAGVAQQTNSLTVAKYNRFCICTEKIIIRKV